MIKNYLKTAFRSLWRNKTYSLLNIFGLAIGVACAGLIFLWVEDEKGYDEVYAKKDRLYTIMTNQTYDGVTRTFGSSPGPMAYAFKTQVPGIANACRMRGMKSLFSLADKSMYEQGYYADTSVLDMLTPTFVQGNATTAFNETHGLVISEKMAAHFFEKNESVVGKTLKLDNAESYIISGVIKDLPSNSTFKIDWIANFDIYYKQNIGLLSNWGSNATNTFIELQPNANADEVNKQILAIYKKEEPESSTIPFLFAMQDWRLRDKFEGGKQVGGRIEYIKMFSIIAWVILFIACINFMNLATARSEKRAKEVGVRKVMGAGKGLLIAQFIGEAVLMSFVAVLIGVLLIAALLPAFNILIEKHLVVGWTVPSHIAALVSIALLCGLVAGSYPALYLSSFNPVSVFKGVKLKDGFAALVRKGLVVAQFTVSIVLIIGTFIIYQQIQHVKSRDLGYDKDHLISIDVRGDMVKNLSLIKQDLLNSGLIENAAFNSFNTVNIGNNGSGLEWQGKDPNSRILISNRLTSPGLIPTLGLKLIEGRDFNQDATIDSTNVIITQSFAQLMGKETAIGKIINNGERDLTVVGVVNDFVYGDMYGKNDPVIFYCNPARGRYLYVRSKAEARPETVLAQLQKTLKTYNPAYPFEYSFVDEQFNEKFKSEMLVGKLSRIFAALAIVISCLGLFGLAAYTAQRRTREIGIRKVLGASVTGITGLLSKDFLRLVFLSAIIAFPLAWWAMYTWLQGYAYRISINPWVFVLAGLAAMLIALFTVVFQSIKAAIANPINSLRSE